MSSGASSGYGGAAAAITVSDVPALAEGATFYSPADAAGSTGLVASWLTQQLERHGPVQLVRPRSLSPATPCVAVCVVGSAAALADLPPSGDEFALAVRGLESQVRRRFGAVYALAAATVSALAPIVTASQLDVPLLDVDVMGRAFPLIHHTSLHLAGLHPSPLAARGPTGESMIIDVSTPARADALLRGAVDALGGWAALASYPVSAGELAQAALPGTISRLVNVGRILLGSRDPDLLVARLAAMTGCRRVGRGRIVELEHLSRPTDVTIPGHPSSVVIAQIDADARLLRLELRSEIVAVFTDGALTAAAPDHICLLDVLRGVIATLDSLTPGDLVDVLVMPAEAVWYSAQGLDMVGPARHGIPLDHPRRR